MDLEITNKETELVYTTGKSNSRDIPMQVVQKLCMRGVQIEAMLSRDFNRIMERVYDDKSKTLYLSENWKVKIKQHDHHIEFKELVCDGNFKT